MKRFLALAGAAALALSSLGGVGVARAGDSVDGGAVTGTKTVATSTTGSYIVVMKAKPLVKTLAPGQLGTPAAAAPAAAIEQSHDEVLAETGVSTATKVQDYANAVNGFSVKLPHDKAIALANNPKIAMVLPDELHRATSASDGDANASSGSQGYDPTIDSRLDPNGWFGGIRNTRGGPSTGVTGNDDLGHFLGLTGAGNAWASGVNGEGVVIGVIDTGIWPEHPSFADDGSYAPPAHPLENTAALPSCKFGTSTKEPAASRDKAFTCNNKLIGAREFLSTYKKFEGLTDREFDSARDDDGHGTHTASTAGGNAGVQAKLYGVDYGKISGIAPRAHIVAYKALGEAGGFTSDLIGAIDQATADRVDVINYSVGGGPDLTGLDAFFYLIAQDAGIYVATSASNSGPGAATIGGPADVPWVTTVGANTQRRSFKGNVVLDTGRLFGWGPGHGGIALTGASVTPGTDGPVALVDAADAGDELCQEGKLDRAKVTGKVVLCLRGGNGRVAKSLAVAEAGGVGMILYNTTDVDNLFTDDFIVPTVMLDHTPGLAVKAFIHHIPRARATLSTGGTTTWRSAPSMTIFSSRGPNPTAPDIIKPDITAPGIQVLAGNTPFPPADTSAPGQLFQAIAGTSMSSPVIAGSLALLKQVHPDWSPAAAKSALMTTADPHVVDNDRVTPAGPFAMGSGMVDVGSPSAPGSAFNPGLVYDAGTLDYLGFLCDAAPDFYLLYDVGITCADLAGMGVPTTSTDLNYPSIGVSAAAGTKTVTRVVTSVASKTMTWRSTVDAPAGYSVTVSPRTLTLTPGQSKAYTVTLTNEGSGPIGSFVDGSVTWTSGRYSARSPIEVQGTRLDAPLSISGTGTSGSTTFTEQFGYTGAYTATAHGLVAPTPLNGTVFQDPDQTFPSPDDGAGVVKLPIHLDSAAALRLTLQFPAGDPDDIDLYLLGPDGTEVARSTNGGTNEQIDLTLPANGDYTLVVHGWQVTEAAGRPFSVQQWIVPTTPSTGNLTVTAPSSATIGQRADVTVAWNGLAAGTQYLGAVSHADADGIFQLTLVDVAA